MTVRLLPAIALAGAGILLALLALAQQPQPQPEAPARASAAIDCDQYAVFARRIAFMRDLEAKLSLVLQ